MGRVLEGVRAGYAKEEQLVKTNLEGDAARAIDYLAENDPFDKLLNEAVSVIITEQGVGGFTKVFNKARSSGRRSPLGTESFVNGLGYKLLGQNRQKEAIEIFRLNVEAYPGSANTYDSLAEAYLGAGEKKLAVDYYQKALAVDPGYPNAPAARELLKKLEAETKAAP